MSEARHLVAANGHSTSALGLLATVYAKTGERDSVRAILRELLARSRSEYVPAWTIASVSLALDDTAAAMTWVEKAYDERSNGVAYLIANPELAPLRGNPRYEAVLTRVGLK
jgi:hypothetical protein